MSIKNLLTRRASSDDEMQEQSKVRSNNDCTVKLPTGEQCVARIRELNWYGLSLDRVPVDYVEGRHQPEMELAWILPREFGSLTCKTKDYVATEYHDPIGDRTFLVLEVSIPESPLLEDIRRYLKFRNKSFIRNTQRRNRANVSGYFLMALWILIITLGVFLFFGIIRKALLGFF